MKSNAVTDAGKPFASYTTPTSMSARVVRALSDGDGWIADTKATPERKAKPGESVDMVAQLRAGFRRVANGVVYMEISISGNLRNGKYVTSTSKLL